MSFREKMIERFPCNAGEIGYDDQGRIIVDGSGPLGSAPIMDAIWSVQDPAPARAAFEQARAGRLAEPLEQYMNAAGFTLDNDGVLAELDLPEDSYEQRLSLEGFEPILQAWEQAWQAGRTHRA
jgi:hypothetical protein